MLRLKRRKRIYYTDTQKALMWDCWQQGESLHRIASLFDRHHGSVRNVLAEHGGIRPSMRRSKQHLAGSGIAYLWGQQLLNAPVPRAVA